MEYEITLYKQEMPPFQKSRSFEQKAFMSDKCDSLKDNQSTINHPKIIEDATEKVQETVELSKSVEQLNGVQCVLRSSCNFPSNLTELELSNKDFIDLPDLFKSMDNLKRLCIRNTSLNKLPDSIGELKNLHELNLSNNELQELPETISNLKHLEKLDLSHNELQQLPLLYSKLQCLRELDLSNNEFQRLPRCIANGMGLLRVLDISDNPHVRINVIPNSKYLEKFTARNNKNCGTFPDWILCSQFFNMKEIDLDNTQFNVYTFNGKNGNLYYTKFSMASSNLSTLYLDMMIEHMVNLQTVNVGNDGEVESGSGNIFSCIPVDNFKNPKLITELNFRGTGLASISSSINTLCNLKKLDLGLNNIFWFPEEFCELKKLECLKIDGNYLILFPNNIGNLLSIQEIHAEKNSLTSLPESFQNLTSLRLIDLYNNEFTELPEVLGKLVKLKGLDLELNYFETEDLKIENTDYFELREYLRKEKCMDTRSVKGREKLMDISDGISDKDWFNESLFSSQENDDNHVYQSFDAEENWDSINNTDDEYEPNSEEINYNERSKNYLKNNFAPLGFCPADLHAESVKKEVISMRIYGSMSCSHRTVEGQFDDA